MAFGKTLKEIIDRKGITAAELSRRTGIPKTTLSSIFKSDTDKISIELFLDICEAVECDPTEFYRSYKKQYYFKPIQNSFNQLKPHEQHLIDLLRQLSTIEQGTIIGRAELLVEQHQEAEAKAKSS